MNPEILNSSGEQIYIDPEADNVSSSCYWGFESSLPKDEELTNFLKGYIIFKSDNLSASLLALRSDPHEYRNINGNTIFIESGCCIALCIGDQPVCYTTFDLTLRRVSSQKELYLRIHQLQGIKGVTNRLVGGDWPGMLVNLVEHQLMQDPNICVDKIEIVPAQFNRWFHKPAGDIKGEAHERLKKRLIGIYNETAERNGFKLEELSLFRGGDIRKVVIWTKEILR